jgi:putative two-component system response regulator
MPDLNGFDVLKRLKASEVTKGIPVIFITGVSENKNESIGLSIGAVDYIRKPFDPMVVKQRVGNQIKIVNLHRELENALMIAQAAAASAEETAERAEVELRMLRAKIGAET